MGIGWWLQRAQQEGHDSFGAFEWTLGLALVVGYTASALLQKLPWLGGLMLWVLCVVALWHGHGMEMHRLGSLHRRRARGTLSVRITWLALAWAVLWSILVLRLAHARAWTLEEGWHDGPIQAVMILGLYHLALGVKLGVARWVYLGLFLSILAVALPGVPLLRRNLYLATAILAGGALLISGYRGRQTFLKLLGDSRD